MKRYRACITSIYDYIVIRHFKRALYIVLFEYVGNNSYPVPMTGYEQGLLLSEAL